jgi:hypothetical protein
MEFFMTLTIVLEVEQGVYMDIGPSLTNSN